MNTLISESIHNIRVGKTRKIPNTDVFSAIAKDIVSSPIFLGENGFEGDEHADTRHHGGPEKAVHFYAGKNYSAWKREDIIHSDLLKPGAFGENITLNTVEEKDIFIGDIFQLGEAVIQVSQNRQPCWKLNFRFDYEQMSTSIQENGRTGWYCRVLQEGVVKQGDNLNLLERLQSRWSIQTLNHLMYIDPLNSSLLEGIAGLEYLGKTCRASLTKRLENGAVEDWSSRLFYTPQS